MTKVYKNVEEIKANVKTEWTHGRHKFKPQSYAEVSGRVCPREWVGTDGVVRQGRGYVSQVMQRRVGQVGRVVAVSCGIGGKVRGPSLTGFCDRMYTKYYLQFRDGSIFGYHSHHLKQPYTMPQSLK